MNQKVFISAILFFMSVGFCNAQQASKAAKPQKQAYSFKPQPSDAILLEKYKDLLSDFDATPFLKVAKDGGFNESDTFEFLTGKRIAHIKKKLQPSRTTSPMKVDSALTSCDNIGFEMGDFTNWIGSTGQTTANWNPCPYPFPSANYSPGFVLGNLNEQVYTSNGTTCTPQFGRFTILTDSARYDTLAMAPDSNGFCAPLIPYLAPGGGGVSVRLGNMDVGGETERLRYAITVDSTNTQYIYHYAIVYQSPGAHTPVQRPFFQATVTDSLGVPVGGSCGEFCFNADPSDPSFVLIPAGSTCNPCFQFEDILVKPWTSVSFDLTPYIGQTVYVEFTTGDCALSGHFGYAYIDGFCGVNTTSVAICPNSDTAILVAPFGYTDYQWLDSLGNPISGETDDTLIVPNPTLGMQFSVTLQSVTGGLCISTFNIKFLEYTEVAVSTTTLNLLCNGVTVGNATAIVDTTIIQPPYSYQWYDSSGAIPGATNPVYPTTTGGTFWVHVTSAEGCTNFIPDTATVLFQSNFTKTLTADTSNTCLASPVKFNLTVTPVDSLFTYSWTPTAFLDSATSSSPKANILIPGSYTYYVEITSSSGCVRKDSVYFTVKANYPPEATAFGKDDLCNEQTSQLGVNFGPGTPGICGVGPACSGPSAITQVGVGTATNTSTTFPAPFGDAAQNTKQQFIYKASDLLLAGVKPGIINSISFFVQSLSSAHLNNNYSVRMGCVAMNEFDVNVFDFVDTASLTQVFNPKQINIVQGWNALDFDANYAWDGMNNILIETCTSNNNFPFVDQNCVSTYSATTYYSCMYRKNSVSPSTFCGEPSITSPTEGGFAKKRPNILFSVCAFPPDTDHVTYTWSPAAGLSNSTIIDPIASPSESTLYTVVIKNTLTGCEDTSTVQINVLPQDVSFTADPTIGAGPLTVTFTNTSDAGLTNYFWDFGDGATASDTMLNNITHVFNEKGDYIVTLIGVNSDGCSDTATATITVTQLAIPNVFTPNGDNNNDKFSISLPGLEYFSGVIFNRWGKKMFEWTDPTEGWDGKNCKEGVYFYVIKGKGLDGQDYNETGQITLVR